MAPNLEDIFDRAAVLPPDLREAFLREACAGDARLRAEVESLLRAHDQAAGFMEGPTIDVLAQPQVREQVGAMVGRYKLLQEIGEGGFGIVFMAEQLEPIRRRVALKIIKLGMDTRQVIARFEAERQALALMDHPNIARVLDAGTTEAGRPYFVMELVPGVSITDYCDKNNLSAKDRLELFIPVCQAVQHAHHKGIIHRDLKPSNVLVTLHDNKPVPKVIDFGVAKAVNHRLTERTLFTEFRQLIGTPEYMSPEQADMPGLDIDTRSDVYSLGVLLYELLAGATPFDSQTLRSKGFAEMQRIIREEEPPKPSTRLATLGQSQSGIAKHRRADATTLRRTLSGDLDWIVMKCLEKDRSRRYDTANALADDVRRYLLEEPVHAAAPSAAYKLRKLARRHRAALASGAVVIAALVLGLALMSYGLYEARRERDAAEIARADAVAAKEKILRQAERDKQVSDLLESLFLRPLPLGKSSQEIAADTVARAEAVFGAGNPNVAGLLAGVGAVLTADFGRRATGEAIIKHAIEYQRRALGDNDPSLAMPYLALAARRAESANAGEATEYARFAATLREQSLGPDSLETAQARETIAMIIVSLGERDRYAEAETLFRQVIPIYEQRLGRDNARTLDASMALAQTLIVQRKHDEGIPMLADALERSRRNPDTSRVIRFSSANMLADTYKSRNDKERAVLAYRELPSFAADFFGPKSAAARRYLETCARELQELGVPEEADALRAALYDMQDQGDPPPGVEFASALALSAAGRHDLAAAKAGVLLSTLSTLPADDATSSQVARAALERLLIESTARAGDVAKAEALARDLASRCEHPYPPGHDQIARARASLAEVLSHTGRRDQADSMLTDLTNSALAAKPLRRQLASDLLRRRVRVAMEAGDDSRTVELRALLQQLTLTLGRPPIFSTAQQDLFDTEPEGCIPAPWYVPDVCIAGGQLTFVRSAPTEPARGRFVQVGGLEGMGRFLESSGGMRNLVQTFDARPFRGKKVRFSADVKLNAAAVARDARAQLWLRVDRAELAKPSLFDNMFDRPIRSADWARYEITGVVDADAEEMSVGIMVFGEANAWFDNARFEIVEEGPTKAAK